jgi:LuxR family transcriptional regulator, maltose regulon positive regulatory protein
MQTDQQQAGGVIALPETQATGAACFEAGRLRPPSFHGFVPRRRLVRRLIASRQTPVVLLAAPTGYGKTSLLSEWAEVDERVFAWVTIEPSDNDVEQIVARITEALEAVGHVGAPAGDAIAERRLRGEGVGLSGLVGLLEEQPRPLVLVLDDAHHLDSQDALNVLNVIAGHLTAGSQLALGSRVRPRLPLARFRARHQLVELHAADLTMNLSEATMLLDAAGLPLAPEHVATLVKRTEGWPAALYLAALSLRDEPDVAGALDCFVGDDGILSEYLREELISGISPDAVAFLRRTSILDQLSSSLCDWVLERSDSAVLLHELARRNLLLEPLDRTGEWYRCNALLREMFRREMHRRDAGGVSELHRRASGWHADHGEVDRAVDHAVAGDDAHRAGSLLWTHLARYLAHEQDGIVQAWLGGFTGAQIAGDAALSLFAAHRHLSAGDLPLAAHWGDAAAAALARSEETPHVDSLPTGVLLIEAVVARHGVVRMGADAARAFELESDGSHWRAVCRLYQGVASHLSGDTTPARELLEDGVHRSAARIPRVEALCLAQLATIALGAEDWELAEDHCRKADALLERHRLAEYSSSALVFAVSALVSAQLGRADTAKESLRQATRLLRTSDGYAAWYGEEARIMLARAAARLTDMRQARTLLAEASRAAQRVPDAPVLSAWLDQALGELDSCAAGALEGASLLTLAELRILRFLPTHLSFREIGDRLHVSTNTVKSQAHAVYRKLDASSRSEAVARAARLGLIWSVPSSPDV